MVKAKPTWTPAAEDYNRLFSEQNPWHSLGEVPKALALDVERSIVGHLAKRLQTSEPRRFQIILGPRRVGKTTSLYQVLRTLLASGIDAKRLWWMRLDHPLLMQISLGELIRYIVDTSKATKENPVFIFLDELAYADRWDLWLKTFYDEQWPVRIVGSSSATAVLKQGHLESGVGRWEDHYLAPYLFNEYLRLVPNKSVEIRNGGNLWETIENCISDKVDISRLSSDRRRYLFTGGFPELLTMQRANEADAMLESQRILRTDAIERAIYKDIPQAFSIDNPLLLERVLYVLGAQISGILSPHNICQQLGNLGQPTLDKYLSYLVRAFIIFCLPNYSGTEMGSQKRGRKLYFIDGAVRNAALQRGLAPLAEGQEAEMGLLIENLVASHLNTLSQHSGMRIYHWRSTPYEVDLILDHPEHPLAFEVTISSQHSRGGMTNFLQKYPKFKNKSYIVSPNVAYVSAITEGSGIGSIQLDALLLAIGRHAEIEMGKRLGTI